MRTNQIFRIYYANINREILATKDQIKSINKESKGKLRRLKQQGNTKLLYFTKRKPVI